MTHQIDIKDFLNQEFAGLMASGDGKELSAAVYIDGQGISYFSFCITAQQYEGSFSSLSDAIMVYNNLE